MSTKKILLNFIPEILLYIIEVVNEMKIDLSQIPDSDLIDKIVDLIQKKEKIKAKKDGKTLDIKDLSSRKIKFYTKKILGQADLQGDFKVISQGDHFLVYFREY